MSKALPIAILVLSSAVHAQSWRATERELRDAMVKKDQPAMKAAAVKLLAERGTPTDLYNVACLEALSGNAEAGLARLSELAAMGVWFDFAADSDLATVRALPGYAEVEAKEKAALDPQGTPHKILSLPAGLLPEDVAYDAKTDRYFVSSVRKKKIVALRPDGTARDFVTEGRDGAWAILGLALDADRRALWATTAAVPQGEGYDKADVGRTALLRYDADTGKLKKRYEVARDGVEHMLGDMTVGPTGDAFASDGSNGGAVYMVRAGKDVLETLVPRGTFASPQQPAVVAGGKVLIVPDYARGLAAVEIATGAVRFLEGKGLALNGIDGLFAHGGALYAVQNGNRPARVVRLWPDAGFTKIERLEVLEAGTPGLGDPTHGAVVKDEFHFIANSGWDRMARDGSVRKDAPPDAPELRSVKLK